jgi:hypothetical protein
MTDQKRNLMTKQRGILAAVGERAKDAAIASGIYD